MKQILQTSAEIKQLAATLHSWTELCETLGYDSHSTTALQKQLKKKGIDKSEILFCGKDGRFSRRIHHTTKARCKHCDKEFTYTPSSKLPVRTYCSITCSNLCRNAGGKFMTVERRNRLSDAMKSRVESGKFRNPNDSLDYNKRDNYNKCRNNCRACGLPLEFENRHHKTCSKEMQTNLHSCHKHRPRKEIWWLS